MKIKGETKEDCAEHLKLQEQIDVLKREFRILRCTEHKYVDNNEFMYLPPIGYSGVVCEKCGKKATMKTVDFKKHQLESITKEAESLGEYIKIIEDGEKAQEKLNEAMKGAK
jgi:hypothetical protein